MPQVRNPTRRQKKILEKNRLKADNWYITKNPPGELHIKHKISGTRSVIKYGI